MSTTEEVPKYTEAEVGADGSTGGSEGGSEDTFFDGDDSDAIPVVTSNIFVLCVLGLVFLVVFAIIMYNVQKRKREVSTTHNQSIQSMNTRHTDGQSVGERNTECRRAHVGNCRRV